VHLRFNKLMDKVARTNSTGQVELRTRLASWILALAFFHFGLDHRCCGLFCGSGVLPEPPAVCVALGNFLVLLRLADARRLFRMLLRIRAAALYGGFLLRAFCIASGCLLECRAGRTAQQAAQWNHAHGFAP